MLPLLVFLLLAIAGTEARKHHLIDDEPTRLRNKGAGMYLNINANQTVDVKEFKKK